MTPTLDSVDLDDGRRAPSRAARRSAPRRCSSRGTGSWPRQVLVAALDAVVELVVAVRSGAEAPAFSTSMAGRSSRSPEFGGDAPTLSPPASISASPGRRRSSSNIVARSAAPPTLTLSRPSHGRRVELAVEVVEPDDRQRRDRRLLREHLGSTPTLGVLRLGDAHVVRERGARSIDRT